MRQSKGMEGMGSGDRKQTVLELMKMMSQSNKFMHTNDIYQPLATQMRMDELEIVLQQLCEDGVIYSSYAKDIYSVTEM